MPPREKRTGVGVGLVGFSRVYWSLVGYKTDVRIPYHFSLSLILVLPAIARLSLPWLATGKLLKTQINTDFEPLINDNER
jgi:hypothetical protein